MAEPAVHSRDERGHELTQPARVLGTFDAMSVVIGAIIGVGIFFTPRTVAEVAGGPGLAMAAWVVCGVIAMLGALTFAEIGGLYPVNGGQYAALRDAFGRPVAFVFVFCNATGVQAGAIGIIAMVCAGYIGVAVRGEAMTGTAQIAMACALIVGLMIANGVGVRWGAGIQNLTVIAKVATLLGIGIVAMFAPAAEAPAEVVEAAPGDVGVMGGVVGVLFAAMVAAFFSYGGWQSALWVAGEVRQPQRTVPLAIVGGVIVVTVVYLLANWAYLRLLGYEGVVGSEALASEAVGRVWSTWGSRVVGVAVALSSFGVLNSQLLSGPRLISGMAVDAAPIGIFARLHPRFGTPLASIGVLGGLAMVLLLAFGLDSVDRLLSGVVVIDSTFFALTSVAVIVLRRRRPEAHRPVRVVGYPVVPAVFSLLVFGLVVGTFLDPDKRGLLLFAAGWVVAGAITYALLVRRRR